MRYVLVALLALSLTGCGCSDGCNGKASLDRNSEIKVASAK